MSLSRRDALRLLGGGAVLAAAPGCGAWSMPGSATAAWRGPGAEGEPRRRALSYALLAPSAHNRQSWLVDLGREGEIALSIDRRRLLPETDPPGRQITISQGAFLEVLDMALREEGLAPQIQLYPEGEHGALPDDRPVARVRLAARPDVPREPLFAQVTRRHTNRNPFDTRHEISPSLLEAMARLPLAPGVAVRGTVEPGLRQRIRDLAGRAWELEVLTPRTFRESLELLRIGATEIERHRDGIALTGLGPWMASLLGQMTVEKMLDPSGVAVATALESGRRQARTAMGWIWIETEGNSRRRQVEAGRATLRLHLEAARQGLAWHPMSQALQEYPEMEETRRALYRHLGADPARTTVQMLVRVGRATPAGPSARRPLDSLLRRA